MVADGPRLALGDTAGKVRARLGQSPTGFIHSPTRREPAVAYSSPYPDPYDPWSGRQIWTGILLANRPFLR